MLRIRIDFDALATAARMLSQVAKVSPPVRPASAIGAGAFGFRSLESAVAGFAGSIDVHLEDQERRIGEQAEALATTVQRFAAYDDRVESTATELMRRL